mgnify:CR=1 FL=1
MNEETEFIIPYGEQVTLHFLGNSPDEAHGIKINSLFLKEAVMDYLSSNKDLTVIKTTFNNK